jgi:SnoaL-like domain
VPDDSPDVIRRYLRAADDGDFEALAACFAPSGFVIDEDTRYEGRDEIIRWRGEIAGKYVYTSELTGTEAVDDTEYRAFVHIAGNFPGGVADLTYRFDVRDGAIASLSIAP